MNHESVVLCLDGGRLCAYQSILGVIGMMEHYKVLGAMLALNEFTVNDLARYSGVKPNTIRTTIRREQGYIEEVGKEGTGKRGGQHRRWRVKKDEVNNLRSKIESLFGQLKASPGALPETKTAPQIPLGLLIAEDTLLRLYPKATSQKKQQELLELAEINFDTGRAECESLIYGSDYANNVEAIKARMQTVKLHLEAHMQSIKALIDLSRLEYDLQKNDGKDKPRIDIHELYQRFTDVTQELKSMGGDDLIFAFNTLHRAMQSPVLDRALRW